MRTLVVIRDLVNIVQSETVGTVFVERGKHVYSLSTLFAESNFVNITQTASDMHIYLIHNLV